MEDHDRINEVEKLSLDNTTGGQLILYPVKKYHNHSNSNLAAQFDWIGIEGEAINGCDYVQPDLNIYKHQ
ncbi:hypothetical protein MJO29_005400 [Puccinia striiformis f. sp. tritici]|nr:hypothetical protein MJO29_005400 [Puccinia striiformis f. sp. tritici]